MSVEDQIEAHKALKTQFDSLSKRFEIIKDKKKEISAKKEVDEKIDIDEKNDEI